MRNKQLDVLGIFEEHDAILEGHFRLPNGLHSPTFLQTALILQFPNIAHKMGLALSAKFPGKVDVVVSPGMGAIVIGQEVARAHKCRSIFFERKGGVMGLHRHFRLEAGERALVIEDILTTGRSTNEVVSLSAVYGAKVVGVGAVVDRSAGLLPYSVPVRALVTMPTKMMPAEKCELCAAGVPLTTPDEPRSHIGPGRLR